MASVKGGQINWKLFSVLIVVAVVLTVGLELYWYGQMCCQGPGPLSYTPEKISFNFALVNSSTNATVSLTNGGTIVFALTAYYVKDSAGDMYSNSTWAGPTVNPGATASANVLLTGKLTGQPFQFQSGQTYYLSVLTARNNLFPYSFTG